MKKIIIINSILTFGLCFLTHFSYNWFPNPIFSIILPVNESIWEHMKMIFTTILLYGIIEYFILKKFKFAYNNFLLSVFLKSIIAIPIYLAIYLPIYYTFGEYMIITFILLFITILFVNYIVIKIMLEKEIKYQKTISIIGIITVYIIMGILTYNPPHYDLFFDTEEEKYGINDYLIKGDVGKLNN